MAILNIPAIAWNATEQINSVDFIAQLGDGYTIDSRVRGSSRRRWDVAVPEISTSQLEALISTLETYGGHTKFQWQPNVIAPIRDYYCETWEVSLLSPSKWQFNAVFTEA